MGPWRPISSNGNILLAKNPYAWTEQANILFLEQPAGVGFSFTNDTAELLEYSDKVAAEDCLKLLKMFFARFPERFGNHYYLASESYGGHYTPQLAMLITTSRIRQNFKGVIVGNPYVSFASGTIGGAISKWGSQFIPKSKWYFKSYDFISLYYTYYTSFLL